MMSITVHCTHCRTAFPVDPAKVPEGGVRVRCTVCDGIFRVEKTLPEPEARGMDEVDSDLGTAVAEGVEPVVQDVPGPQPEAGDTVAAGSSVEEPEVSVEVETRAGPEVGLVPDVQVEPTGDRTAREDEIEPAFEEEDETRLEEDVESAFEEESESEIEGEIERAFEEEGEPTVEPGIGPVASEQGTTATEEVPEVLEDLEAEPVPEVELEAPDDLDIEPKKDVSVTTEEAESPKGFRFGRRDPHDKAKRLARVLVSDMITYNPERHRRALAEGTLEEDFREEIDRSWKEYTAQVGREIAENTDYWTEALNEILARGDDVF